MFKRDSVVITDEIIDNIKSVFNIQFCWVLKKDSADLGSCEIFYYAISEDELLKNSLFNKDDIISYFVRRAGAIDGDLRKSLKNFPEGRIRHCRLMPSDSIYATAQIRVDFPEKIYLFYVYDDEQMIWKIALPTVLKNSPVPYSVKKTMFWEPYNILKLEENQKKVMIETVCRNKKVYSLLPDGYTKLYINKNSDINNKKIVYFTSVIDRTQTELWK